MLYACTRGIYSSREIERVCRENENVHFMYLLEGHAAPDHNTIARFHSQHLSEVAEDLLYQMVQILAAHRGISFEESTVQKLFLLIEANPPLRFSALLFADFIHNFSQKFEFYPQMRSEK